MLDLSKSQVASDLALRNEREQRSFSAPLHLATRRRSVLKSMLLVVSQHNVQTPHNAILQVECEAASDLLYSVALLYW